MALTPNQALYGGAQAPPPPLPPCVHYAGSEKFVRKALLLQADRGPAFDIACRSSSVTPSIERRRNRRAIGNSGRSIRSFSTHTGSGATGTKSGSGKYR